jgi:hypothetical protein
VTISPLGILFDCGWVIVAVNVTGFPMVDVGAEDVTVVFVE